MKMDDLYYLCRDVVINYAHQENSSQEIGIWRDMFLNQNKHLLPDDPDHGCYIIQLFMVMPVASFIKKSPLQNLLDIIEQCKDYKPFKR